MPRVDDGYLASRRRQIMDAAVACFAREGFHRATMADIVAETGLSAGAIYRYFPAKEDIVAAIAAEHHAREAAVLADAREAAGAGDVLRDLARVSLGRLADPAEQRWRRVTIQLWGEALRDERVMRIVRSGLDEPVEIIAGLLRRGQAGGGVPDGIDPHSAARVCAAIFQGLVLQQAWDPGLDIDGYIDAVIALIGGFTGLAGPGSGEQAAEAPAAAAGHRRCTPPR
jgi:TetR/AcrR family transcriptional regulator, transcriptional repressor of aconitase